MDEHRLGGGDVTDKQVRERVAMMRELGIIELDGIKLGPAPVPIEKPTAEEKTARRNAKEERDRDILFAASHVRPYLEGAKR